MSSIPSCGHSGIVGVSLSKKLYSHCSSPPSCNINGYLVITGEANVKLGPWVPTPSPLAWPSLTCRAPAPPPPQVDLPALARSARLVPRHPVPHWVGVTAMRQLETLLLLCYVRMFVCVTVYACVRMHSRSVFVCVTMCECALL